LDNILKPLYGRFNCQPDNTPQEERIKANHQLLRQRLSKRNRKLVLRTFHWTASSAGSGWHGRLQIKYKITTGVRIAAKELSRTPVSYFKRR
jgi:hypothetical protein